MTLNPEDLVVFSFETTAEPSLATGAAAVFRPIQPDTDPNNPTPNTYCFVCD